MKKIRIIYSSITGNTKKVAESIFDFLTDMDAEINSHKASGTLCHDFYTFLKCFKIELHDIKTFHSEISDEDITIICFWCRRASLDDSSISFLDKMHGKNIMAVGTLSGDANGKYGDRVRKNVQRAVAHANNCLGVHLCQGHSSLKRIEPRRHLDPEAPKYVSPEKWEHHLSMQEHPDKYDIQKVIQFVEKTLSASSSFTSEN